MRPYFSYLCLFSFLVISFSPQAQTQQPNAAEIKLKLKKLNFLGSVLYMAAHPDDENTRIITYFAKGRLATAGYLSMTRGDGGQNLIGPELRDELGVIRTQELLAARRIDGGEQYFTRANDFGFSKSATETFNIWGKDEVMSDVLKVFKEYQPDVIITRFPPDERAGHGHHTASAVLAQEAFDLAIKPDFLTDNPNNWKPTRLFTNTGRWWNKDINEKTPGIITLDIGGFNSTLGKSYAEIAALSSSQHKSQGWGQQGSRGYQPEFLELVKGGKAEKDIFDGINTTWTRLKGGEKIKPLVDQLISSYDIDNPSASLHLLFQLKSEISKLNNSVWKQRKLAETNQLIQDCIGLFIEVTASSYHGNPGDTLSIATELVNRSSQNVILESIKANNIIYDTVANLTLNANIKTILRSAQVLKTDLKYSEPYWLSTLHAAGLFNVDDKSMIGKPENNAAIHYTFTFSVDGQKIEIERPLIYKWVDPVKGELKRRVEVVPPVFMNLSDKVIVFSDTTSKSINVVLTSSSDDHQRGTVSLGLPAGWRSSPMKTEFEFQKRGQELVRAFTIHPPKNESNGTVTVVADINGKLYKESIQYIEYDHIPVQTLLPDASFKVVRIDLKKEGSLVGYIKGAGDGIPLALRNMGYQVWEMTNEEVTLANLRKVDAVVLGIRAVNTNSRIRYFMADLFEYAKQGGTVVMQYNTNFDLEAETFTPYPLTISRDRVTQEDADVRFLKPQHQVLNTPNKITPADFSGWVQERGLYFPSQWDPQYEAILSMNDKGETAKDGSLLVAKYGNGQFVYTGISFFRELPEGVPGAYKLFANLVSAGKTNAGKVKSEQTNKTKSRNKAR
jgi:LmbE family N-acetylglucosaminyl deacetylase